MDALSSMTNPSMMTDMLKGNISMAVTTMGQYAWVSYFFSGFILAKVPFPLTQGFKMMLQRGISIEAIDVTYISSLSLYFMILFGISSLLRLLLASDMEGDEKMLPNMSRDFTGGMAGGKMGMGGGGGMPG